MLIKEKCTIVHVWLYHTAHCAEKIVATCLCVGSESAVKVGQGEVGEVTRRVVCTWWVLDLVVKGSWLGLGGLPLALTS